MLQLAGGVTADQLKLVPELVVPEDVNPVGALGLAVQEFASVVTFTAELAGDEPSLSVASTVKL